MGLLGSVKVTSTVSGDVVSFPKRRFRPNMGHSLNSLKGVI